ncbi:MAG: FkbM family methyltransferase, partial [Rhodospirillales bacterium]
VLDALNMPHTYASSVFNVFGGEIDSLGNKLVVAFRQMVPGFRIDDFVKLFNPPLPNHIKIDVDSVELQILEGAQNLLANKEVESILIEVQMGPGFSNSDEIT